MKFFAILCTISSALALATDNSTGPRDPGETVNLVLLDVLHATQGMLESLKVVRLDSVALNAHATNLLVTLQTSKAEVEQLEPLHLRDVLRMVAPLEQIAKMGTRLNQRLATFRPYIKRARKCEYTRTLVNEIHAAGLELKAAVMAKLPVVARRICHHLTLPLERNMEQGVRTFNQENCARKHKRGASVNGLSPTNLLSATESSATESTDTESSFDTELFFDTESSSAIEQFDTESFFDTLFSSATASHSPTASSSVAESVPATAAALAEPTKTRAL